MSIVKTGGTRTAISARRQAKPAEAEPLMDGAAIVQNDKNAAGTADTNPMDKRVTAALDMAVVEKGYMAPSEYPSGIFGRPLRVYFAAKGTAASEEHNKAANMIAHMDLTMAVRVVTEEGHPCLGQLGVFAKRDIDQYTVLGMYGGLITSDIFADLEHRIHKTCAKSPADRKRDCGSYVWSLPVRYRQKSEAPGVYEEMKKLEIKGSGVVREPGTLPELEILGLHGGNLMRFINSYHGIVDKAQRGVHVASVWWRGAPRLVYVTRLDIKAGQELLVDYSDEHDLYAAPAVAKPGVTLEAPLLH